MGTEDSSSDGQTPDQETGEADRLTSDGQLIAPISPFSNGLREAAILLCRNGM